MKNSIVIFILGGVFLCAALVIGYIYIPKLDQQNGSKSSENLILDLPVDKMDMRYLQGGVWPFCVHGGDHPEGHGGIDFELKTNAPIYAAADATVLMIGEYEHGGNQVVLEPTFGMVLDYVPVVNVTVKEGDYILKGDVIGYAGDDGDGKYFLHFGVRNNNDDVYVCPYSYFTDEAKKVVMDGLEMSEYVEKSTESDICNCNTIPVKN